MVTEEGVVVVVVSEIVVRVEVFVVVKPISVVYSLGDVAVAVVVAGEVATLAVGFSTSGEVLL